MTQSLKKHYLITIHFPLVLPLEGFRGGFMGMNFHYLSPVIRFRLLNQLQRFATNNKFDSTTRLDVGYQEWQDLQELNQQ